MNTTDMARYYLPSLCVRVYHFRLYPYKPTPAFPHCMCEGISVFKFPILHGGYFPDGKPGRGFPARR